MGGLLLRKLTFALVCRFEDDLCFQGRRTAVLRTAQTNSETGEEMRCLKELGKRKTCCHCWETASDCVTSRNAAC